MVEMSDLPLQVGHPARVSKKIWFLLVALGLCFSAVSWGLDDTLYVGSADGLEVKASFFNIQSVDSKGAYVFRQGQSVNYRVMVKNRSNSSFAGVQVQASLHSDGAACGPVNVAPGQLLPGPAISSLKTMNLDPLSSDDFESTYPISSDLCPSDGFLKIRLTYQYQNRLQNAELVSPLHFHFDRTP